jgi:6-phosphogluconolactonase
MKLTRLFLALLLTLISAAASSQTKTQGKYLFYVGTYTVDDGKPTNSKGIYASGFDSATGETTSLGLAAEGTNPSFVAVAPNGHFLYAVNEVGNFKGPNSGGVSAFSIDRDKNGRASGKLTFLNEVPSRGAGPCYIIVDRSGKYVLVANYDGGSVAVFPIQKDGSLGEASAFVQHTGHGADPQRQEAPHAHSIDLSTDNRLAYVDDLGLDEVLVYKFDAAKGTLTPNDPPFAKLDPGSGPRHFALRADGKFAYVLSEIKGTVTAFANDNGKLRTLQTITTLPPGFSGHVEDAEIEILPSQKFLYASNRGHDSIAVFAIDHDKGTLTLVEIMPTQGKTPRHFQIDPTGNFLFAENEESNNVVVFRIDQTTGKLTATGKTIDVAAPVCLKFAKVD